METFYAPLLPHAPATITLDGEEGKHMTQVLRMRPGERCRVVDGKGNAYDVSILSVAHGRAECGVEHHHVRINEPAQHIVLGAGLLKNPSRFDYLVEKAVELGVSGIVPLVTERIIVRGGKTARWQKIAVAAMKQCGRSVLPLINDPVPLEKFFTMTPAEHLRLIPHERSSSPFPVATTSSGVAICIGPEGGFTEEELQKALESGFIAVSLGPRRLRAETAALVSVTLSASSAMNPAVP
jgi:16S rRNA (uracil1498-N3)-methyltransferase